MTWRPLDCHAHSTWSDGDLSVAEVAQLATERGVRATVADHVTRDISRGVTTAERFEEYVAALERHEVFRAAEHCWHDALWRELPDVWLRRLTHRIGSLHAVFLPNGQMLHAFSGRFPTGLGADAYMDAHLDNLERFAREMPVDILAHPTLLPHALRRQPLEELWTEPREERAVAALKRAGIAFEISNRYRPHERFVRRAHDAGVRLSLGSDGHTRAQVADVAWPLALARAVGASDGSLYDPSRHGSRTGFWEPAATGAGRRAR